MGFINGIRHALGVSVTFAMLAGCSGGGSQVSSTSLGQSLTANGQSHQRRTALAGRTDPSLLQPGAALISRAPIGTPSFMDAAAGSTPLIFISDVAGGVVNIYPQAGHRQKIVGQITGFNQPQGMTTDSSRNLYVANTNDSNVLVYAPPYTKGPALTLDDSGEFPADVAVSKSGLVAVTNICSTPRCGNETGSISFYAKGGTKPCAKVSDHKRAYGHLARVNFAAFDKNDNLYVDGTDYIYGGQAAFGLVTGGCKAKSITVELPPPTYAVFFPGSLQVTKIGTIALVDEGPAGGGGEHIATFEPPANGQWPDPISQVNMPALIDSVACALLISEKFVYCADAGNGLADELSYIASGPTINTINVGGQPLGVAVTPADHP